MPGADDGVRHRLTDDEILAAVETAEDWGSYVAVHVHQDFDIARVLDLGVKFLDRLPLMK